jgi:hypothetical protein
MNNSGELRRLLAGPEHDEKPSGQIAEFVIECKIESTKTLLAARIVWRIVLEQSFSSNLNLEKWHNILPHWFVEKCEAEITIEEALHRRTLSIEERIRLSEKWSLSAWVHWLQPEERQWSWWKAEIVSSRLLKLKVVAQDFPFPNGSLEWLFKCCGAVSIELSSD